MEKRAEPEGPHMALVLDDTFHEILSYLDPESLKTARLVCRKWNDSVLANFHKKLTFTLCRNQNPMSGYAGYSVISTVNPKILSSVSMCKGSCYSKINKMRHAFGIVFSYVCSFGLVERMKVLELQWVDARTLYKLIKVMNEGSLKDLRELRLIIHWTKRGGLGDYKMKNSLTPNALSGLRLFASAVDEDLSKKDFGLSLFRAEQFRTLIQSFVAAAPNLENVETNISIDLLGRKVRKLKLTGSLNVYSACASKEMEKAGRILDSAAKESLTHLSLRGWFPILQPPLPVFPNLSTLIFDNVELRDVSALSGSGLRRMEFQFPYTCLELLGSMLLRLLPPSGKLKELFVTRVHIPFSDRNVDVFSFLLNLKVDRLILSCPWGVILPELLEWVRLVRMEDGVGGLRKSGVLELHDTRKIGVVYGKTKDEGAATFPIQGFSTILEMFGGRWGLIRFVDFKCRDVARPTWSEKEVPLFGGEKRGRIRVSSSTPNQDKESSVTVCLKIVS